MPTFLKRRAFGFYMMMSVSCLDVTSFICDFKVWFIITNNSLIENMLNSHMKISPIFLALIRVVFTSSSTSVTHANGHTLELALPRTALHLKYPI